MKMRKGASVSQTGLSSPTEPSSTVSALTGFDPSRLAAELLPRLGQAQKRVILSLTEDWGEAACHKTAKRMFHGVGGQHRPLVLHKHCTDNCWALSDLGMALKQAIAMEAAAAGETGTGSTEGDSAARRDRPNPIADTPQ
jgi:hypothetical protein